MARQSATPSVEKLFQSPPRELFVNGVPIQVWSISRIYVQSREVVCSAHEIEKDIRE